MISLLLPGDPLPSPPSSATSLHLGPGLQSSSAKGKQRASAVDDSNDSEQITANRAGLLGHLQDGKGGEKYWIEGEARRYIPHPPEPIIGIIIARHAEGYRVDIGSSQAASLDALAFEGATKRNKPNLKVGTLIYAHLLSTPPFSEPEISCVDLATQKAAGFGPLTGGFLLRGVELGRCRALLAPRNELLGRWGGKMPFEVAVGMNGRVWVKVGEGDEEGGVELARELRGR